MPKDNLLSPASIDTVKKKIEKNTDCIRTQI